MDINIENSTTQERAQKIIDIYKENPEFDIKQVSDGYHTFGELYEFRMMYNAVLFNLWAKLDDEVLVREGLSTHPLYDVHKSWKHNDGEWCFGEEKKHFKVSAMTPFGEISNHYKAEHWDLFKVPEVEKAKYEFDGHTGLDTLTRLKNLINAR